MPAYGVIAEFDRALKAIKKDPSCFPVWQPILSKYQPTLLGKCAKAMGLDVSLIEDDQDLQELVLTVHHCFIHTLTNTMAGKIIENHLGNAVVKSFELIS